MEQVETLRHEVKILTADKPNILTDQVNEWLNKPGWVIVNNSFFVSHPMGGSGVQYSIMMVYTETHINTIG